MCLGPDLWQDRYVQFVCVFVKLNNFYFKAPPSIHDETVRRSRSLKRRFSTVVEVFPPQPLHQSIGRILKPRNIWPNSSSYRNGDLSPPPSRREDRSWGWPLPMPPLAAAPPRGACPPRAACPPSSAAQQQAASPPPAAVTPPAVGPPAVAHPAVAHPAVAPAAPAPTGYAEVTEPMIGLVSCRKFVYNDR